MIKTIAFLLFISSMLAFISCESTGNWAKAGDGGAACYCNELSNTRIVVTRSGSMAIITKDFRESLPDVIKLEVSFEDGKSLTIQAVDFRYHSFAGNSYDGYYGIADEMGGLVITVTDGKFYNALYQHAECRITSEAFTDSFTFKIKGLAKVL